MFRRGVVGGVVLTQGFGKAQDLRPAGSRGQGAAGQPDPFTAPLQQDRQRQPDQPRAVALLFQRSRRGKAHGRPLIDPKHDRLRDLPFAFAHELMVPHGRTPVVDAATAIPGLCRTVLPEIIPHPCASTPMGTQQDCTGQMLCTGQQRGQTGGLLL